MFESAFHDVSLVRSRMSSAMSAEVFIVATNLQAGQDVNRCILSSDGNHYRYRSSDLFENLLSAYTATFDTDFEISKGDITTTDIIHRDITPARAKCASVDRWITTAAEFWFRLESREPPSVIEVWDYIMTSVENLFDSSAVLSERRRQVQRRTLSHDRAERLAKLIITLTCVALFPRDVRTKRLKDASDRWTLVLVDLKPWAPFVVPGLKMWIYLQSEWKRQIAQPRHQPMQIAVYGMTFNWQNLSKNAWYYQLLRFRVSVVHVLILVLHDYQQKS